MSYLVLFLLLGIVIGYKRFVSDWLFKTIDNITFASLIGLLAALGAKITLDEKVFGSIGLLSIKAFVLMFFAVAGSVIAVWLIERRVKLFQGVADGSLADSQVAAYGSEHDDNRPVHAKGDKTDYSFVKRVVGALIAGGIIGKLIYIELHILNYIVTFTVNFLCFGVGTEIGRDNGFLKSLRSLSWKCILVPFGVLMGSMLGAALGGLVISLNLQHAVAIGAACGFYSLAGGLLDNLVNLEVGTIAFLTNFFREITAFVLIPLLAAKVTPLSASSPGGATAMDTTLPLIFKTLGTRVAIIAMISGVVLTILGPILLPIIISM